MKKLRLRVTIDRPIGFKDRYGNVYPINYGFVSGVIGKDGEEQDVYVISKDATSLIDVFEGVLVALYIEKMIMKINWS